MKKLNRKYTWKPDLPDHRDHVYAPTLAVTPPSFDLTAGCSPVFDQGQLGSCTGNAWAGMLEFLEIKAAAAFWAVSRLFIYYLERAIEGTVSSDAGAQIRDGAKALAKTGYCHEKLWPYIVSKFRTKPPTSAYTDAAQHKISEYMRVVTSTMSSATRVANLKACLAEGYPVVFGFTVYDSFESDAVARTGFLNMPQHAEQVVGGHAVLLVGYDDATQRFRVRNSWGAAWGQHGYFTMPYAYLAHASLASDFWTVRK